MEGRIYVEHELIPWSEALLHGELKASSCIPCGRIIWPPRSACPRCQSADITWSALPSTATLFTWTGVYRTNLPAFVERVPYAVCVFEFKEQGIRLVGFTDTDPARLEIGQIFRWHIDRSLIGRPVAVWELEERQAAK